MRPCGLPGARRAASTLLLGLAPGGVCLAGVSPRRRCALTAPFHPYRRRASREGPPRRRCHFCGTFPRVSPGRISRPLCPTVSGLSSRAGFLSDLPRLHSQHPKVTRVRHRRTPPSGYVRTLLQRRQRPLSPIRSMRPRQTGQSTAPVPIRPSHTLDIRSSRVSPGPPETGLSGCCSAKFVPAGEANAGGARSSWLM